MKFDYRQRLLGTTLLVGASLLATPAYAQDTSQETTATDVSNPTGPVEAQPAPATSAEGEPVEEAQDIVVTGSRIPQPNLDSVAPVTVVSNQDVKLQGTSKVEDLLNSLPSVAASQSNTLSNAATGTATVDLRGLGAVRTLTLVNGRRVGPGTPAPQAAGPADINIIPASLIRRIEVLTGGASSTYGADAVAGVVNFIMDTNFTGVRFDGQYSFYQHNNKDINLGSGKTMRGILNDQQALGRRGYSYPTGNTVDGGSFDGTISIGTKFDDNRGSAVAYFGYRKINEVTQDRRIYSACTIQNSGTGVPVCGGSGTSAEGNIFTSTFAGFNFGTPGQLTAGRTVYNFAPTNYFQRPDERYVGGVFANYEISELVKPYIEFMFMDDRTVAQIAPSGNFGNTLTLNCDNPLLSAQQRSVICAPGNLVSGFVGNYPLTPTSGGPATPISFINPATGAAYNQGFVLLQRRNVEGGPRRNDLQHTNYRGVVGTRGDLSNAWSYDAYYQYNRVNYQQTYSNEFSTRKLRNALDVVDDPRVAGIQPICRSVLTGADPNCVPYDIFTGAPISAAALAYVSATGFQRGQTREQVANANFTGLLGDYGIRSPLAEDGVGVNVGVEYRKTVLELQTDEAFSTGDLTGQGAPTLPLEGNIVAKEWFAEAQIPLVQNGFIHELSASVGFRKSFYETSADNKFDTNTYKLGVEFAPIRDIRLRGAYNRAVRAPNPQELFAQTYVGLSGTEDPCAGRTITAADVGCIATGLAVGAFTPENPAGQYQALLGGNPDLQPEKATTKTLGVVLQPGFLPRFALSIDYYDIEVKDAIQGFGADAIIQDCVENSTAGNIRSSCSLVTRDPGGSIWLTPAGFIDNIPTNIGGVTTNGYEFNGSYSHRLGGLGSLSASFNGTWLRKFEIDNGLATETFDCVGLYGGVCSSGTVASAPLPKWRHKFRTTFQSPIGVGVSLQWRYFGKVRAEEGDFNYDPGRVVKAQSYIDLATTFSIGDSYNLRLGVNNLFDKAPPLVTSGNANRPGSNYCPSGPCSGNTYPAAYDALGRYLYAGVTLDF